MKSAARFSGWVVLATLLAFAPCALGQGPNRDNGLAIGNSILTAAPASFLAFSMAPNGHRGAVKDNGGGCSSSGGDRGWGHADRDSQNGGGCLTVPEGGTTFMYLLLAGLFCFGAIALRSRRQAGVSESN
jgi:hypothetical protein